ncbi:MAG: ABC transporter ATP-binding protein [Cellulosilyticum sp.]|nr:ABC transporter ATP-binding protein [Cellulosilyticum sp.]
MEEIKRLVHYMGKRKWKYISILIVTLAIWSIMEVVYSYMYQSIFHAIEYQDLAKFKMAVIMCIIFVICRYFQPYMRYFEMKQVRMIVFDIKIAMFEKLTHLNMQYFEENHSGDVLKRLNVDANYLKDTYFSRVYQLFVLVCRGGAAIIAMLIYSPQLATISIIFSLLSVAVSIKINQLIGRMSIEIAENVSRLTQRLVDIISGFLVIKMYHGAVCVMDRYEDENIMVKNSMQKRTRVMSLLEMLSFLIGMLGNFGTIIVGVFMVTQGKMDYGTVMGVVTLQMSVSNMFQFLGSALANFTSAISEAQRVFDFLELDQLEENVQVCGQTAIDSNLRNVEAGDIKQEDVKLGSIKQEKIEQGEIVQRNREQRNLKQSDLEKGIDIKDIKFAYKGKEPILSDLNLHIDYGERVMITGESGCGKSSLLKLLLRFYEEQEGKIEIFGKDIRAYSLEALRNLITYVPQESYLFEGSIKENIQYGSDNTNEMLIHKAARMAYADEFIKDLPEGYDTKLVAGGRNLSGGQRQRVAIARAFLKNAPIILLDEPSSALDVESERKINLAMNELMKDKIVIMVTHRTNSFDQFDRQIHIEKSLKNCS